MGLLVRWLDGFTESNEFEAINVGCVLEPMSATSAECTVGLVAEQAERSVATTVSN